MKDYSVSRGIKNLVYSRPLDALNSPSFALPRARRAKIPNRVPVPGRKRSNARAESFRHIAPKIIEIKGSEHAST